MLLKKKKKKKKKKKLYKILNLNQKKNDYINLSYRFIYLILNKKEKIV